jgi:hypothetical protein
MLVVSGYLFDQGVLNAATQTIAWSVIIFFFASAGASSAYLTVSEIFPVKIRAEAIAVFFAIAQELLLGVAAERRGTRTGRPAAQGTLNHVADAYQPKGVRFLAVATQDTRPRVLAFARTSRITYPVLLDPAGTPAQRLQVPAVPVTVVLDRDGRIAARLDGHLARQTLSARLDVLLSGKTDRQPP